MAGNEIAQAWVTLIPSFKGGQGAIVKELGAVGDPAGRAAGSGFISGLKGTAVVAAGNLIASGIGRGVDMAVGAVTKVFSGGWDRMLNLQDARIMLGTIGAPVEASMKAVEAGVDGTKFAISDAAGMAANLALALGNGAAESGEMERWIALTGDAAQFTGREFTDIQRIMQKVVADGKVTGDTFQEMPIAAAALADHLGVSQEEVRKLGSQGKISAEDFAAAMEGSIGGAARDAGGSIRSMMANIATAVSATGANFLAPMEGAFLTLLDAGLQAVKGIRDAAAPVGEAFSAWITPHIEGVASAIGKIPETVGVIGPAFSRIWEAVQPLVANLGQMFGPLIPQLVELWTTLSPVQMIFQALQPLLPQIGALFGQIAGVVGQLLAALIPLATQLAAAIVPALTQIAQAVLPALGQIMGVIAGILPTLVPLFVMVGTAVASIVSAVAPLIAQLVSALVPIFTHLAATVIPVVIQALQAILPAVLMVVNILTAFLVPVIQMLLPIVQGVFTAISSIISGVMQVISGVIQVVLGVISGNWGSAWNGIKSVFAGIWNIIVGLLQGFVSLIGGIISGFLGLIGGLWNAAWTGIQTFLANTWNSIVNVVSDGVGKVGGFFRDLPGQIGGFLAGLPGQLMGIGRDMIQGLINGIKNMAGAVTGVIGDVIGGGINAAKQALGINSPSRVFMQIGEYTGEGLAMGIGAQARSVQRATDKLMPSATVPDYVPASRSAHGSASVAQPSGPDLVDALVEALSRLSIQLDGRTTIGALARTNRR